MILFFYFFNIYIGTKILGFKVKFVVMFDELGRWAPSLKAQVVSEVYHLIFYMSNMFDSSTIILMFIYVLDWIHGFWEFYLGKCITSICWRPDGKAIAVGLEDGTISLHDVEVSCFYNFPYAILQSYFLPIYRQLYMNIHTICMLALDFNSHEVHPNTFGMEQNGKLLRNMKFHFVSVVCLNWEEDRKRIMVWLLTFFLNEILREQAFIWFGCLLEENCIYLKDTLHLWFCIKCNCMFTISMCFQMVQETLTDYLILNYRLIVWRQKERVVAFTKL